MPLPIYATDIQSGLQALFKVLKPRKHMGAVLGMDHMSILITHMGIIKPQAMPIMGTGFLQLRSKYIPPLRAIVIMVQKKKSPNS